MRQRVSRAVTFSTLFLLSTNATTETKTISPSLSQSSDSVDDMHSTYYGIIPIGLGLSVLLMAAWMIKSHLNSRKQHHKNPEPHSINASDQHSDETTPPESPTACCISLFSTTQQGSNDHEPRSGGYQPIPTDDQPHREIKGNRLCPIM